jgi:hypothetical protein
MSDPQAQNPNGEAAKQAAALQFLQRDYELRLNYLTTHLGRVWQRFNIFIVLESSLSAALWLWLKDAFSKDSKVIVDPAAGVALIGFSTSLVWYMFGAQDRRLFVVYQTKVTEVARILDANLGLSSMLQAQYTHVGEQKIHISQKWYEYIYQWRFEPFSTTKLAAWFPLLVTLYWIGMLIWVKQ